MAKKRMERFLEPEYQKICCEIVSLRNGCIAKIGTWVISKNELFWKGNLFGGSHPWQKLKLFWNMGSCIMNSASVLHFFSWGVQELLHTMKGRLEQSYVPWSFSSLWVSGLGYTPGDKGWNKVLMGGSAEFWSSTIWGFKNSSFRW